jgi:tripartite-type tricarboxylate transporter receptor subunit TctC
LYVEIIVALGAGGGLVGTTRAAAEIARQRLGGNGIYTRDLR